MQPEIKRLGPNTYSLPEYAVEGTDLKYTESDKTIRFARPEMPKVTQAQIDQATAYKEQLEAKKEELTEQEQSVLKQVEDILEKGPQTLPATQGLTIVDLATLLLIESHELKINPQALVKLEEYLFWLKK